MQYDTQDVNDEQQALIRPILQVMLAEYEPQEVDFLAKNPAIYNAIYDLSALIYVDKTCLTVKDRFAQILQQGRASIFSMDTFQQQWQYQHCASQSLDLPFETQPDDLIEQFLTTERQLQQQDVKEIIAAHQQNLTPIQETVNNNEQTVDMVIQQTEDVVKDEIKQDMTVVVSPQLDDENKKMPFFNMTQNARVGVEYAGQILMQNPIRQTIELVADSVRFSHDNGLSFDATQQQVVGKAEKVIDNFYIEFDYIDPQSQQTLQGKVQLTINPNPRDIWQDNEPDVNLPYAKPHTAKQTLPHEKYTIYAMRRRGRSHAHGATYCDDDFFVGHLAEHDWSVMVVADGAGSAKFSRQGSKIAADSVGEQLLQYIKHHHAELDQALAQWQIRGQDENTRQAAHKLHDDFHVLFYRVSENALAAIQQEADRIDAKMRDFATTLLVAVVKYADNGKTFVVSFAIGDGAICAYHPTQEVCLMNQPDGGEHAGQTQFLSDIHENHGKRRVNIRHFSGDYYVMLMTDGVSDPMFASDHELQSAQHWHAFWQQQIEPQLQHEDPAQSLLEWSNFYREGHHDDRTLLVFCPNKQISSHILLPSHAMQES